MVLSLNQISEASAQPLEQPLTLPTRQFPRTAESVFAVMPAQLLVEASNPFLLVSDTVGRPANACRAWPAHNLLHGLSRLQARHVCAGTAARTMAQAIIHPIDTIKTRLQVRG